MTKEQSERYSSEEMQHMQSSHPIDWQKVDDAAERHISSEEQDFDWTHSKLVHPKAKKQISLRVDHDLLEWFKKEAGTHKMRGYQSFMHSVLQSYREAKRKNT